MPWWHESGSTGAPREAACSNQAGHLGSAEHLDMHNMHSCNVKVNIAGIPGTVVKSMAQVNAIAILYLRACS